MRISIIVPAFNEEKLIGATLRRIQLARAALLSRNWEVELIVCDNNSSDRTSEVAGAAGARVVFEPVNQIARARNTGAGVASGDWLVFVDADSHPSPELFTDMAAQIASGRCMAGGSTIRLDGHHPGGDAVARLWNGVSRALSWLAGSFIFCETAAFRKIGGFNNELYAGEELELSRRLKRLARAERKRIVILHRHPILTSPRKVQLYSGVELVGFVARKILSRGRTLKDRDACFTWYDGRR